MLHTEKEKLMQESRELYEKWEITIEQLQDKYFDLYMKK